jgi:hypothetical protein
MVYEELTRADMNKRIARAGKNASGEIRSFVEAFSARLKPPLCQSETHPLLG